MRDPETVREQTIREWLRLAEADLEYADIGMAANAEPRLIGFHAQQAVEKSLKALLTSYAVDPGDTHDVGRLLERLRLLDRSLVDSLGPLGRLTPYAVFYRYPPRLPGTPRVVNRTQVKADLELAHRACHLLMQAAEHRLQPKEPGADA